MIGLLIINSFSLYLCYFFKQFDCLNAHLLNFTDKIMKLYYTENNLRYSMYYLFDAYEYRKHIIENYEM